MTQTVLLWEGAGAARQDLSRVKYSVIIVSTRRARRLQAVLQSIAHQRGVEPEEIEVIVCYVPDIDATDDLIDSMRMTHPRLRIVRSAFPEHNVTSKGLMINESVKLASGEWIMLLDADTLLAPDTFARVAEAPDDVMFIAPDGRKMLTPETTARILLGELASWETWDELLKGPGEFRLREADGVPIGFCQLARRSCFEKVGYTEQDHFEGADWFFGTAMREHFHKELRLSGVPVLHLDHQGSQWYGGARHL